MFFKLYNGRCIIINSCRMRGIMIKIAICGNNIANIKNIVEDFMNVYNHEHYTMIFNDIKELAETNQVFDIFFLYVNSQYSKDFIEVGKYIKKIYYGVKIIYISSEDVYIKEAINDIHAFAYIKEPFLKDTIIKQLTDVMYEINNNIDEVIFKVMNIKNQCISYDNLKKLKKFKIKDIFYFECFKRKIKIRTLDNTYYIMGKFKDIVDKMSRLGFICCHQSYLVNMYNVDYIKGYNLYMKNGEMIPISQKKSAIIRIQLSMFER